MPYSSAPEAIAPSTKYFMADSAAIAGVAIESDHRVDGQREQLDADIDGQQAVGGDEHEDAEQRGQSQHVVLARRIPRFSR